jgi:putative PIN family toxin of toxin-antitoxin system
MNIILDTNIALNLWFFNDATTHAALAPLLRNATVHGTPAMLVELLRVARSPHLAKYASHEGAFDRLEKSWRATVQCHEVDPVQRSPLRCRDADDQIFLDLAHQISAAAIITLDRDLLKLKKRAKMLNLQISPYLDD